MGMKCLNQKVHDDESLQSIDCCKCTNLTEKEKMRMKRVIMLLSAWCPGLSDAAFLPSFSEPFVKLYGNDELGCVEVLMSIISHWCQHFLIWLPNPPVGLLQTCENILHTYKRDLLDTL